MFAWLFACTPDPSPLVADPSSEAHSGSPPALVPGPHTGAPAHSAHTATCEPAVGAVWFDLGETLATEVRGTFYTLPATIPLLEDLDARGIPTGILTNTEPWWDEDDLRALLDDPSFLDLVDVLLLSSEASARPKPDPAIFAEAHALLPGGVPIERAAFVTEELEDLADSATSPTVGARAAGMVGVWVGDRADPLADLVVPDLAAVGAADWLACR